jgi:dienelactone hydrolase
MAIRRDTAAFSKMAAYRVLVMDRSFAKQSAESRLKAASASILRRTLKSQPNTIALTHSLAGVRLLHAQTKGAPVKLVIYPGAYHAFDVPALRNGVRYLGHWVQYDADAARRSVLEMHDFLATELAK